MFSQISISFFVVLDEEPGEGLEKGLARIVVVSWAGDVSLLAKEELNNKPHRKVWKSFMIELEGSPPASHFIAFKLSGKNFPLPLEISGSSVDQWI